MRGAASISRPTMNFCRLPPERLLAAASGPRAFTLKAVMSALASSRTRANRSHPRGPNVSVRVSNVFWASESVGTAPRPRRSSGTKCSPARRRWRGVACPTAAPKSVIACAGARAILARERGHQLGLTVARDPCDADDLARSHFEIDRVERHAERVTLGERETREREGHFAQLGLAAREPRRLAADHEPREARVGLFGRGDDAR